MDKLKQSRILDKKNSAFILLEGLLFFIFMGCILACLDYGGKYGVVPITVLCFLLVSLIWVSSFVEDGFFNPLCIWEITWLGSLIVARVRTDLYPPASQDWSFELELLVYLNTIIFYVIYRVVFIISAKKGLVNLRKNKIIALNVDQIGRLSRIVNGIVAIAICAYILNVITMGGVPLLQENLSYRIDFQGTTLFTIFNVARILAVFYPLILLHQSVSKRRRNLSVTLFAVYALCALLTGSRGVFFQWFIAFITGYLAVKLVSRRNQQKIIIILIAVGIVLVGLFGYAREFFSTNGNVTIGLFDYIPYIAYTYIAPNFINFGQAIQSLEPLGAFVYSTEAIWSIFLPSSFFNGYQNLSFAISAFNVSTYLLQPYADLGGIGTFLVTAAIAGVAGGASSRLQSGSISALGVVAILNIIVFFMQNTFMAKSASVAVWFLLVVIISVILRKFQTSEVLDSQQAHKEGKES